MLAAVTVLIVLAAAAQVLFVEEMLSTIESLASGVLFYVLPFHLTLFDGLRIFKLYSVLNRKKHRGMKR